MKLLIFLLAFVALAARAQTYDVSAALTLSAPSSGGPTFTGSFVETLGQLYDVNVAASDGTVFTSGTYQSGVLTLNSAGLDETPWLVLDVNSGGQVTNASYFDGNLNAGGLMTCGAPFSPFGGNPAVWQCSGTVTDPPAASVHAAPEFSWNVTAVVMMLGLFAIAKGRRIV